MSLENQLGSKPELKMKYPNPINTPDQRLSAGHMELADTPNITDFKHFVLPHCAVMKCESFTPKYWVVFDSSAHNFTSVSLNQMLNTGRKLNNCFLDTQFQLIYHHYDWVMTSSKYGKSFHLDDSKCQPLIKQKIQRHEYWCTVLCFRGTSFLAIRTLHHLIED